MNERKPERFLDTLRNEREKYDSESQTWRIVYFVNCACAIVLIFGAGVIGILNIGSEQDATGVSSLLALFGVALLGIGISHHKCQAIKRRTNIIDKIKEDLSKMNPALVQIRDELRYETSKSKKLESNHRIKKTFSQNKIN
jgi:hypothetical protein